MGTPVLRSAFCSRPIEVWYPIESSGPASGVIDFETDPDHIGDTLFDRLDGSPASPDNELVDVREADIRFLLDRVLGGDVVPDGISANAARVGMLGHSIGSVTVGRVAENDSGIAAVVGLAAPIEVRE